MRRLTIPIIFVLAFAAGCAPRTAKKSGTLAELRDVKPDVEEVKVEQGLEQAMVHYRQFLDETPEGEKTPEAMRRLADLELEKEFGIRSGDGKPREVAAPEPTRASVSDNKAKKMAAPERAQAHTGEQAESTVAADDAPVGPAESDREFEQRTTASSQMQAGGDDGASAAAAAGADAPKGPLEAIAIYQRLLNDYPSYKDSDQVLYQMARAYDELGRTEEAMETMGRLIETNPYSEHFDEVQFRRGEFLFTRRKYRDAEKVFSTITKKGPKSEYYELALYKLGWTFYKQEFYEEAMHRFVALLDYKVSTGYDFDQKHEEDDQRRVGDTFRVISLSLSNLGGPEAVEEYFSTFGNRSYEDRVYNNLGDYYLAKLRYDDAAKTFKTFIAHYPFHRAAPQFSMKVVETFTRGGFPKLVLESKREFASRYGLQSEYWKHHKADELPEVLAYLKTNLKDLATHYHAEYQSAPKGKEKQENYQEALRWYGEYLESFPKDAESPAINYELADLLLENKDFGQAAKQYERTAYEYPAHSQSAAAGYAAVYAHRQQLAAAGEKERDSIKRETVTSSLRFANTFPDHAQAAAVLGAAADDMYEMKEYRLAVESAQRVVDKYPNAELAIRRPAWIVIAHGSFELAEYPQAEKAYTQVLAVTPENDKTRASFVDNLAASIYKQGEKANEEKNYRAAADNFLRIRTAAPTSSIRPTAEYDAGVALIELKEWNEAVGVFKSFRESFPKNKLRLEASKQIAFAYRESGQLANAADEYNRLSSESKDPELRREALLVAGDLYQKSKKNDSALYAYIRYVNEFPHPVETAVETRSKIADMYKEAHDDTRYHQELKAIVEADAKAGKERTGRTRTIAANAGLVLAELVYQDFVGVKLRQPFEASLKDKQQRMDRTIEAMDGLVKYEIADTTAAATYYMAETYFNFSRSLLQSERPTDLDPADVEAYESGLDEAAFPFEERAIKVHESNMELLHSGVYDEWTKKSLARLIEMMPGRYKKDAMSSGFISSIDNYAYRAPNSYFSHSNVTVAATAPSAPQQTATPSPAATKNGGAASDASPHSAEATTVAPQQTATPAPAAANDSGAVSEANPQGTAATPAEPEQASSPAEAAAESAEPVAATPEAAETTPSKPEQTTKPVAMAVSGGEVNDATQH